MSRPAAWALSLPLTVVSWLAAHCLAYWLVAPRPEHHLGLHAESSHAYLGYTPALGAWLLVLVLAGLVLCVGEGLRGRRPARPPLRLFVLLPPIGFVVQEHVERLVASGTIPHDVVLEPTFLVGLALQLPFAVAALLLVLALQAVGFGAGCALARGVAVPGVPAAARSRLTLLAATAEMARPALVPGHGPRGPPATVSL